VAPWREEPTLEQVAGRTCDQVGDPRGSSLFLKDCTPWEGPTLGQFVKSCSPWEGPLDGAGEEHEEEGASETTCDELTATPIPHSPVLLRGRRRENCE